MPTLKSEKVQLRAIEKDDIEFILKWFNDSEVIENLQFYLPLTRMAEEKWFEKISLSQNDVVFLIEVEVEDGQFKPIGTCGLHEISPKDRVATLGIAIGEKDFWNGGYGTAAARLIVEYGFCQLNLHKIESCVYAGNDKSLRMHEKLGFENEGLKKESVFKNGKYRDIILKGLLRRNFKA